MRDDEQRAVPSAVPRSLWRYYIATIWIYNNDGRPDDGHARIIERGLAPSACHFMAQIHEERADDEYEIGVISLSKDQTSGGWTSFTGLRLLNEGTPQECVRYVIGDRV